MLDVTRVPILTLLRAPILCCLGLALPYMTSLDAQSVTPTHLDSIAIVASRAQAGTAGRSVDIITSDDIARSSAHNLADLLGSRISIDAFTRSGAQADIAIRGSTAEQVLILVDGVRMSDVQSAHYATDLGIPLSAIERIEILRGQGSALYGPNAIGGVINIVTVNAPTGTRTAGPTGANLYTGTFGTIGLGAYSRGTVGTNSVSSALQFDKSDGHRPDTDYRIYQVRLGANRNVGAGTLATDASVGIRDFGASDFYSPYQSSERTGTTAGGARWAAPLGAWAINIGANTRLHTDRFILVRGNPAIYENRHRSWQTGAEATARTGLANASLVIGADAEHDQLSSARLGGRREWRMAAFMEQAIRVGSHVNLTAGERDDHASTYGDVFSPSLSIAASATPELTLRGSVARGFRAPTWTERYYVDPGNVGNPLVQPERFLNAEVGTSYTPLAAKAVSLKWDAAAFVRRADNLIDWVRPENHTDLPWRIANVGTATFRGIESSISASPASGVNVTLGGSAIAFDDVAATGIAGKYALQPITRQLNASISLPLLERGNIALDLIHARRATQTGYTTGNARVTWPVQDIQTFIDARNLANAFWLDASGDAAQGRALFVGLEWRR